MKRRGFLWRALAGLFAPGRLRAQELEPGMRALAAVVLPASLGQKRCDQIAAGFVQWVRDYKPGAEIASGYGFPRTQVTSANPGAHYAEQLQQLNLAQVDGLAAKRSAVERALEEAKIERIPQRPNGKHVAADLLAYLYGSSDGEDFLYGVAIRRDECRGLGNSAQRPPATA